MNTQTTTPPAKHTPGPWITSTGRVPGLGRSLGVLKESHKPGEKGESICVVCKEDNMEPHDIANAELIADAPRMFETLAEIADLFGIGRDARTHATIITNVKNALRRNDILSMIEEYHSTLEKDEDGVEIQECPLRWGEDPDAYLARYVELLADFGADTTRLDHLHNVIESCPHTELTYDEDSPKHPWSMETRGCDTIQLVGSTLRSIIDQSIDFQASGEDFEVWQAMREENDLAVAVGRERHAAGAENQTPT